MSAHREIEYCYEDGCRRVATRSRPKGMVGDDETARPVVELVCRRHAGLGWLDSDTVARWVISWTNVTSVMLVALLLVVACVGLVSMDVR